uniref:R3H domain-containing protein n=1 Tax=Anopheles minimus TaxID=112268 RepID=A0A182WKH5_9DIPT
MRESTSPPRTPTPRSPSDTHNSNPISSAGSGSTGGITNTTTATTTVASSSSSSGGNALCNGPQSQSERSPTAASTMNDAESLAKHNSSGPGGGGLSGTGGGGTSGNSSPNIVLFAGGEDQQRNGKSQLDLDFPKLTPPKTSFNPNAGTNGSHHPHSQKGNSVKSNGTATHHGRANGSTVCETDKSAPLTTTAGVTISLVTGGSNNAKQTTPSQSVTSTVSSSATGTDTPDGGGTTRGGGMLPAGQSPSNQNLVPVSGSASSVSAMTCDTTVGGDPLDKHHGGMSGVVGKVLSTHTSPAQSAANSNYCDNEGRHGPYQHQQHQRDVSFSSGSNEANADGQINIQFSHETETRYIQCDSPTDSLMRSGGNAGTGPTTTPPSGGSGGSGGKKRSGASGKGGNKATRLKNLSGGSSSSVDGGGGGGGGTGGGGGGNCGGGMASFMSRDSLCDPFTDQSGVNLLQFFKETLNKNFKDRNMLMKIEKELLSLAMDRSRSQMKFPPMSSYNRMLIHRVAAYFGMEHNVDATQQCVIAEVTPATRIPDIRFKNLISDSFSEEPRKSILKRDTHSFDEYHRFGSGSGGVGGGGGGGSGSGLLHCPDRGMLDRKAKSFEEREEEYEKSKRRLFKNREWQWISTDGGGVAGGGAGVGTTLVDLNAARHQQKLQNNRLLKVQSVSIEGRSDERPCVSKSHSFGGYGGSSQNASLLRGDSITSTKSASARLFTKQDSNASTNTPWRLSPSSSGSYLTSSYKTQSIRSDSVTPSPTGYGSGDHTPEPCVPSPSATCGVMWAVTDMASVPKGSVLIDPQTFQPIVNQDGSLYHFDPSNLPPSAGGPWPSNGKMSKRRFEKQKSFNSKNNLNSSSSLESSGDGPPLGKTVECGQQTAIPAVGENVSGAITTIMTVVSTAATTTPTTIAEEVVNELGCYDIGVNSGGLKLLSVKDNPDMDENSSLCEEISQTTNELGGLKLQKHQATSPMLQASELQPIDMNEIQYGTNHNESGNLMHTANSGLLDNDRSLIDEVETTGEEQDDLGDTLDALDKSDHNNPAMGAAVQLLHVHDPVSSSSTLDAGEDDEDRSETPTDGGQEEVDKKNDMVKVANVVQTVVPLTSYASTTTTPNGGSGVGGGGVSAYTVTYDGGGSGHPGATVYATGTPGLSTTTYQTAPDGAIYAVPSSLVYTYPTTMDPTEMSGGYFVPVYDPQQQREASLCSTPGASIYSAPAGATSTVLHPIAYTQSAAAAAAAAAAAYTGAPLYQNPVMYSSDQFPAAQAAAAAAAGQLSQYPISYPIGIGYPFNGAAYQNYWNQPITYYVPQTPVPSTVGGASILMQPPIPQTPTNGGIITTTATVSASTPGTGNGSSGAPLSGKRNTTPPNSGHGQSQGGATHSASVTPVPISPFTTNISVPLPDSSSAAAAGAPMYAAFPQPLYPNMLPFASPMATHPHPVAATAGTLVPTAASFHPHPPSGGSQHHASSGHHVASSTGGAHGESTPLSGGNGHHHHSQYHHHQQHHHQQGGGHYSSVNGPSNGGGNSSSSSSSSNSSHSGGNHSNNCPTNAPTPQSTPSTPLSLPMSMPSHHGGVPGATHKGMPLFPTPPIMPNVAGGGGYGGHHHYGTSDERKTGSGGYQGSKPRQPNANSGANGGSTGGSYFNYNASANGGRQMTPNSNAGSGSYQPSGGGGMKGSYAQNNTGNNNQNQNGPLILGPPPSGKGNRHDGTASQNVTNANSNSSSKPPLIPTLPSMVVPGAAAPNTGMGGDKSRLNRSSKPPNLDLKRSYNSNSYSGVNNRNTPSTNSNESNGSPNSITSSSVHEHGAAQSHHPMAPPHHAATHHHGGHGGNNHPSTPTSHHHGGNHPVVSAGGQPSQHGAPMHHHHSGHPHAQHHPHHGGSQPMPPGVQQQTHGGPGGGGGGSGGGGTTHYYHPGGGQSAMAQAGGQPHTGQSSYYSGGAGNGPSQRGGSVGSNGGGNGSGSGSGGNAHTTAHPHAMPAAVMHNSAVAAAAAAAAVEPYHQQLIPINAATGMSYVKIGQAYYPSLTLPQSRRSPPNEIRPIAGVYPTMNMMMPASRQFTPRPQHSTGYSNAKAAKSLR